MVDYGTSQQLLARAIVDEMVRRGVGIVAGSSTTSGDFSSNPYSGGTGDATAANQQSEITLLSTLRDRLPSTLSRNKLAVDFPDTLAVSIADLPIPSGAATEATLVTVRDRTPVLGQNTAANSTPVTLAADGLFAANFGSTNDVAANNDVANSSLLGLFKRLLGRITTIISYLPTSLSTAGRFLVESSPTESALITEFPLTAPSATPPRSMLGYNRLSLQVDVEGLGTNVVVRLEGNLIGSSFVNLSTQNSNIIITANGSYLFLFEGKLNNVRLNLVSISGGSPSVTCTLLMGN